MIVYAASPTKTLAIVLVTVGIVALLAAIFTLLYIFVFSRNAVKKQVR